MNYRTTNQFLDNQTILRKGLNFSNRRRSNKTKSKERGKKNILNFALREKNEIRQI